jgi:hypothetical protein
MAQVSGITIERTMSGKPVFARIDLRKHADMIPILENKGVEVEKPVNWSEKMKRSFAQAKNGEYHKVDMDDFWNI